MYRESYGGAEPIAGEALIDAVVLSSRLVVGQDQTTSAEHLLDPEPVDRQRPAVLRPPIPGPTARTAQQSCPWVYFV